IAQNMGISRESPYRIEGGIRYTLNAYASNGHVYVPREELIKSAGRLLDVDEALIEDSLREMALKGTIQTLNYNEEIRIYYTPFHVAENNVSKKLVELCRVQMDNIDIDIDRAIEK